MSSERHYAQHTHSTRPEATGDVEALLVRPPEARWLMVLAHGAGAGMRHPFLESLVQDLAGVGIASLRYQFPYMQRGGGRPDPPAVLTATVRAAINAAGDLAPELRLLAGGKSLGGRMTSHLLSQDRAAEADHATSRIHGLVFFGFPLHPPGHPGTGRATHLDHVELPMLFFQGTRDTLADLPLMRSVCTKLGPRVTLHVVETADHSFHILKRSGTTDADVLYHLARTTAAWADSLT